MPDGTPALTGPLPDQAALHGPLNRLRDLSVPVMSVRRVPAASHVPYPKLIGALFLSAFVLYGGGNGLATSAGGPTALAIGALMMLLNSAAVVGLGVLFFPVLVGHGQRTALGYLASRIVEAVFLAVGVLSLLVLLPAGQETGAADPAVALRANAMAYQVAMASLGVGGIFLCALLLRTRLVPRLLAGWGLVGYAVFLAGAIAEIFGLPIGLMLAVPGGLFELAFGGWLIVRGFPARPHDGGHVMTGFGAWSTGGDV
jgi:hypothetical protein